MKSFDINLVSLEDEVFSHRRELIRRYMHDFDLDRLMYSFRANAGIKTDAEPLGGWERPECAVRGQFIGHFLAASAKFAYCGDEFLRDKAFKIVDILEECARPDGFLSAYPEEELDKLERNETFDIWAPYYVLHKIIHGLVTCGRLLPCEKAITLAVNLARYIYNRFRKLSFWKIDNILRCTHVNPANEFGGIGDALYSLWETVKEDWIMELAKLFDRDYFLCNLSHGRDVLTDLHANTHIPMVISAGHRYTLTGEEKYKNACLNFYKFLAPRTFANGNSSSKAHDFIEGGTSEKAEHWSEGALCADDITGGESESCCAHNTENVLKYLIDFDESNRLMYLTHMETLKYNAVLNSADKETGLSQYHQPLGKDSKKKYSSAYNNFWCCTGSGVEAMSELQKDIWFEDGETVFINLFVSSTLRLTEGAELVLRTDFPKNNRASLTFKASEKREFSVGFKKGTVKGFTLNGKPLPLVTSDYADVIKGEFKDGDTVEFEINADIRYSHLSGDDSIVCVYYGNILLAKTEGEYRVGDTVTAENGKFGSAGATFIPLYEVEDETYTVYFNSKASVAAEDGSSAYC